MSVNVKKHSSVYIEETACTGTLGGVAALSVASLSAFVARSLKASCCPNINSVMPHQFLVF